MFAKIMTSPQTFRHRPFLGLRAVRLFLTRKLSAQSVWRIRNVRCVADSQCVGFADSQEERSIPAQFFGSTVCIMLPRVIEGDPMPKRTILCFIALLFANFVSAAPGVGDLAPDWTLPGSDGMQYTLSELRGKHVVIAFFPKAFTGG